MALLGLAGVEGRHPDGAAALIEQAFLAANVLKIPEGGWLPLIDGRHDLLCVLTWVRGSVSLRAGHA